MDLQLAGRSAIVTGGSLGIGKAIALVLAEEGVDVTICARTATTLAEAAADVERATQRQVHTVAADVASRNQVDAMVEEVVTRFGRLDILVNNAGIPGGVERGPLETVSDEGVLLDIDVKYVGYLRCARAAAPHMQRRGFGRIINIGGYAGLKASAYSTGARNLAVLHLSRILAVELGPHGITSNVVHPGVTSTERSDAMLAERAEREGISVEEAERRTPTGNDLDRRIAAREVADLVAFLGLAPLLGRDRRNYRCRRWGSAGAFHMSFGRPSWAETGRAPGGMDPVGLGVGSWCSRRGDRDGCWGFGDGECG